MILESFYIHLSLFISVYIDQLYKILQFDPYKTWVHAVRAR